MDNYSNFLKQKDIGAGSQKQYQSASGSYKKKSCNEKLREGSGKRHKTPTHIDVDHKNMKILLDQDYKAKGINNPSSRNDFNVYTSKTEGPSLDKHGLAKGFINQARVKDYVQIHKSDHIVPSVSSCSNKKTFEKLTPGD
jgi:hypothetical protein